jgi:hypothetical protein
LDEALTKVVGLLKPGGFIFIEEFAHELIDEPTATFVYGMSCLPFSLPGVIVRV